MPWSAAGPLPACPCGNDHGLLSCRVPGTGPGSPPVLAAAIGLVIYYLAFSAKSHIQPEGGACPHPASLNKEFIGHPKHWSWVTHQQSWVPSIRPSGWMAQVWRPLLVCSCFIPWPSLLPVLSPQMAFGTECSVPSISQGCLCGFPPTRLLQVWPCLPALTQPAWAPPSKGPLDHCQP